MATQRWIVRVAGVTSLALFPALAYAGAGGTPAAPGAGRGTDYCCANVQRSTEGRGGKAIDFVNGTGCVALDSTDTVSINSCPGTVVKCRGEFFKPALNGGTVERCLTP